MLGGQNFGAAVDGMAHAVKDPAQHVAGHGQLQRVAQKADLGLSQVNAGGGLEELNHGVVAVDLQHLAAAGGAVGQLDFAQLVVGNALDIAHQHQRAGDLLYGLILPNHASSPPFAAMASISAAMSAAMAA
ncbi:hypothetical protein SDC9_104869 [bioreactor metagenome]|uniref:Uncharacterized protein n=1 Tax=bioreactor metagenome TaxID=1076179 RepID=A0A645AXZ2_9ZZZZ